MINLNTISLAIMDDNVTRLVRCPVANRRHSLPFATNRHIRDVWSVCDLAFRSAAMATADWRPVKHGAMLFYTVGRSYLLELCRSL